MMASVSNNEITVKLRKKWRDSSTLANMLIMIKANGKPAPNAREFLVSLKMQDERKLMPLNTPNNKKTPIFKMI